MIGLKGSSLGQRRRKRVATNLENCFSEIEKVVWDSEYSIPNTSSFGERTSIRE